MARLKAQFTPAFARDVKRLRKKHIDGAPLKEVINLILDNTPDSNRTLYQRHNMHSLMGAWSGSFECHICNAGDWLLIWTTFECVTLDEGAESIAVAFIDANITQNTTGSFPLKRAADFCR